MKTKKLLHFPISTGPYTEFVQQSIEKGKAKKSAYTCVANVHMLVEAFKDPAILSIVKNADLVTPDGMPLTWALRLLHGIRQPRVAGMDLLPDLLQAAEAQNMKVYFYGGSPAMLQKTGAYLTQNYPALQVAGLYSPPFRALTEAEEAAHAETINASAAHLVFVVLGCPKQEKWMARMKGRVQAHMIGVGGALPVLVGMQKRAPHWAQKGGLEWLYRLCQEPRRLFKRYAVTNTLFLYLLSKELVRVRLLQQKRAAPAPVTK